jgi:hypothetical protein
MDRRRAPAAPAAVPIRRRRARPAARGWRSRSACGSAVSNWLVPGATTTSPTTRSPSHARRATTLTPWPTPWDSDAPKRATRPMTSRPAAAFGCWSEPSPTWVSDRSRARSPAQGVGVTRPHGPGSRSRSAMKVTTTRQATTDEICPRRPNDRRPSWMYRSRPPGLSRPPNRSRHPNRSRPLNRRSHPLLDRRHAGAGPAVAPALRPWRGVSSDQVVERRHRAARRYGGAPWKPASSLGHSSSRTSPLLSRHEEATNAESS